MLPCSAVAIVKQVAEPKRVLRGSQRALNSRRRRHRGGQAPPSYPPYPLALLPCKLYTGKNG